MIYKILKNIFFVSSFLLYLITYSLSEINLTNVSSKKWSNTCSEDKKTCLSAIKYEIKNNDKMQTLASAFIQIGSTTQKK